MAETVELNIPPGPESAKSRDDGEAVNSTAFTNCMAELNRVISDNSVLSGILTQQLGSGLIVDPENDGCCYADGGHKGVGTSVVAGVDAPPVF